MKKIKLLLLSSLFVLLLIPLTGCGGKGDSNGLGDSKQEYEKIMQDFITIKDDVSIENIEKVTGIKPEVITDGVEEYGSKKYEYKFDYGFAYEAYITVSYSHDPDSIYEYDTTRVELKCPNEAFEQGNLNLSSLKEEEFKADINKGIKVSTIDKLAGGMGLPKDYTTSYKTGKAYVSTMVWADKNGNYIRSSLSGDETVNLQDKVLSFVYYTLKQ